MISVKCNLNSQRGPNPQVENLWLKLYFCINSNTKSSKEKQTDRQTNTALHSLSKPCDSLSSLPTLDLESPPSPSHLFSHANPFLHMSPTYDSFIAPSEWDSNIWLGPPFFFSFFGSVECSVVNLYLLAIIHFSVSS